MSSLRKSVTQLLSLASMALIVHISAAAAANPLNDRADEQSQGHAEIAAQVKRYVVEMPKPLTEKEYIATKLLERASEPKIREIEIAR
jgi:hypothetical protein